MSGHLFGAVFIKYSSTYIVIVSYKMLFFFSNRIKARGEAGFFPSCLSHFKIFEFLMNCSADDLRLFLDIIFD